MESEPLQNWLQEADRSAAQPNVPGDLAGRVLRRASRRRKWRMALAAAAILSISAGLLAMQTGNRKPPVVVSITTPKPHPSIYAIDSDIRVAEQAAQAIQLYRQQDESESVLDEPNPLVSLDENEAAVKSILLADARFSPRSKGAQQ